MDTIKKPRAYLGIIVFIMVIAVLIFVAAPVQFFLGMWGLAITELILLLCAVIPALILKWDLREIFRIKLPMIRQLFGVLIIWVGGYLAVLTANIIIMYFFPEGMTDVGDQITDIFLSVPFPITFLIVAVMPAICEEVLHRGFLQYAFGSLKKWPAVIVMGFLFGVFHLDPYRFLGTAILGAVMTYIMIETRNILLPMLFHFINNAFTVTVAYYLSPGAEQEPMPFISVGVFLMFSAVVPFLFLGGSLLLRPSEENRRNPIWKRHIWIALGAALVLGAIGAGITIISAAEMLMSVN